MITNTGSSPIDAWTLAFDFAPRIHSIWGASLVQRAGHRYVVEGAGDDSSIAPGQSVSFSFMGTPGRGAAGPSQIELNGVALSLALSAQPLSARASFVENGGSKRSFGGTVTIENLGTVPIGGWVLQFDFASRITSVTNAAIVRHTGSNYVIRNTGYDGVIAPGASLSFQLRGSARRLRSAPTKYRLNGKPIAGGAELD